MTAYFRAPDHPMKLRLWHQFRQLAGYPPLTIRYGAGSWISVDERDWLQSAILSRGTYEPEVWQALAQHVADDEVVWDVGACIGSFVLQAAQDSRVKTVCAFEPDPVTVQTLRRNLAMNGNPAIVYPIALSDTTERRTLTRGPSTNTGMSTLGPTSSTGMTDHVSDVHAKLATCDVMCRSADELIRTGSAPAPTLMKIDVEGWEFHVLSGAHRLLLSTQLKAIAFEAASGPTGGLLDDGLISLLRSHGYVLSRIPRPEGAIYGVENYLAVHA